MSLIKKKLILICLTVCTLVIGIIGSVTALANTTNYLAITYGQKQTTAFVGEEVAIAQVSAVYPDKVDDIYFSVENPSGNIIENDGVSFTALDSGNYKIFVCVLGVNGKTYAENYTVEVTTSLAPILSVSPSLPSAFIEGSIYPTPIAVFTDYNTSTPSVVDYDAYIIDEFGNQTALGQVIAPSVSVHGAKIGIKYVAKSEVTGETKEIIFSVPVLKPFVYNEYYQRIYSYDKMFVTTSVQGSGVTPIGATFYGDKDFSIVYANKIDASFSVSLKSESSRVNFKSVIVTVIDYENPNEKITVEISNSTKTTVSVNGGVSVKAEGSFSDFEKGFILNFNNGTLNLTDGGGSKLGKVLSTIDGRYFNGFSSDFVTFEIELKGVSAYSTLAVEGLNGQSFGSGNEVDYILPMVRASKDFKLKNAIGDIVKIPSALAYDVIDPCVTTYVTVYTPTDIVTSLDEQLLMQADGSREYEFVLNEEGEYTVQYIAVDVNGNMYDFAYYSLFAIDVTAPTLTIDSMPTSVSLGKTLKMPKITCTDNDTDTGKIVTWITVSAPNGQIVSLKQGEGYTFSVTGTYYIRFSAMDKTNNVTTIVRQIVCK